MYLKYDDAAAEKLPMKFDRTMLLHLRVYWVFVVMDFVLVSMSGYAIEMR